MIEDHQNDKSENLFLCSQVILLMRSRVFFQWQSALDCKSHEAKGIFGVISLSMLIGAAVVFFSLDPIKALLRCAVVNGVNSVLVMAAMMMNASRPPEPGRSTYPTGQRVIGWTATGAMGAVSITLIAFSLKS
jgi:Mn2+/Fe2+ NRAMP family transporter